MPIHLYRNTSGAYVFDHSGLRHETRALLVRAQTKQSLGVCVTASPLHTWISSPRQVFAFAPEDGQTSIHVGGFEQGPFAWDDYSGDFYQLSALDLDLLNNIRSLLSELDFGLAIEWLTKLHDLLPHINWYANSCFALPSNEERLAVNDEVHFQLRKVSELLTKYIFRIHKAVFE